MKLNKIYTGVLLMLVFCSCSNWLEVLPENKTEEDDLFATGNGYRVALNGLYQQMSGPQLYGQELSWGFLSVLSQHYRTDGLRAQQYQDAGEYEYGTKGCVGIIEGIWQQFYNTIANCNNLVAHVEKESPATFELKELERNMIMGEAYAIRAFAHFELWRLFAPAPVVDGGEVHLAYHQEYPEIFGKKLTATDYLGSVIEDLKKAKNLLATIDTLEPYVSGIEGVWNRLETSAYPHSPGLFFNCRGTRFNYYAITALLARVYRYAGMPFLALTEAREILDCDYFSFTPVEALSPDNIDQRDQKAHYDILFALYNNKMDEIFKPFNDGSAGYLVLRNVDRLFQDDGDDYRGLYMVYTPSVNMPLSIKWRESSDAGVFNVQNPLIPVIRLSEMYYIAGEGIFDTDPEQAIDWLDAARLGRGCKLKLPRTLTKAEFLDRIELDARREYIAEGQLFYFYKRLNREIYKDDQKITLGERFILPVPASEDVSF